jgi:hypothetical protein
MEWICVDRKRRRALADGRGPRQVRGGPRGTYRRNAGGGYGLQVMDWSTMTRSEAADEAGKEKTTEAAGIGVTADA